MAKITYEDKEFLNKNENIADKNKVNDTDLNEIKNTVNENDDNVGDLSDLNTTNKDNLVSAVNELITKNLIFCTMSGNAVAYSAGTEYDINWINKIIQLGNKITLNSNNKDFIIGDNVQYIKLNCQVWYQVSSNNTSYAVLYLYINNSLKYKGASSTIASQYGRMIAVINNIIIPVKKGDVINIKTICTGSNGTIGENQGGISLSDKCWISIEEL